MQEILGKNIVSIHQSSDDSWIYFMDDKGEAFTYEAEGDCCASVYVEDFNYPEYAIGLITKVEEDSINLYDNDHCDVLDATFYRISTCNGTATIELRISHNGYYGGALYYRGNREPNALESRLIAGSLTPTSEKSDYTDPKL